MNESRPTLSLIKYLETDRNGFVLDLAQADGEPPCGASATLRMGPYTQTLRATIKTDAGERVKDVLMIMQRDSYDPVDAIMAQPTNRTIDAAWRAAFAFHRQRPGVPASAMYLRGQVGENQACLPFQALFYCKRSHTWFHPVCPQCGSELALCQDDALLTRWGLGTYSDSVERFMYCPACSSHGGSPAFFVKAKKVESPEYVHDFNALVQAWWKTGGMQAGNPRLPCGRCPHNALCTGIADADTAPIRSFAFYPFYLLMLPAPTCSAEAFLRMIGGEDVTAPGTAAVGGAGLAGSKFLFAGHARWFLELLYLKLTFLHQVCRRFISVENDHLMPEMALGLDGIGVDIQPGGVGLPAYWNFKVRVLDAIGTARHAPFAPLVPESPCFYFLGSLWFRALLVNSRQAADVVFDRIGRWIGPLRFNETVDALSMDMADPADSLAPGQIFWIPDQCVLPAAWQAHWQQALRLGARLVHAGLKSGAALDPQAFLGDLEALLDVVRSEMLAASPAAADSAEHPFAAVAGLRDVLRRILVRWEASETPVETFPGERPESPSTPRDDETILMPSVAAAGVTPTPDEPLTTEPPLPDAPAAATMGKSEPVWDNGLEDTVVFSPTDGLPPDAPMAANDSDLHSPSAPADFDSMATLISPAPSDPSSWKSGAGDAAEQTVLLSRSTPATPGAPKIPDETLAVPSDRRVPAPPLTDDANADDLLTATVVLNTPEPAATPRVSPIADDDLAATMIQGAGPFAPSDDGRVGRPAPPAEGLEATLVISPRGAAPSATSSSPPPPPPPPVSPSRGSAVDDLAETLIQTPRSPDLRSTASGSGPTPPPAGQPAGTAATPGPKQFSEKFTSEEPEDDDTVLEQTVIIRSHVRKE